MSHNSRSVVYYFFKKYAIQHTNSNMLQEEEEDRHFFPPTLGMVTCFNDDSCVQYAPRYLCFLL